MAICLRYDSDLTDKEWSIIEPIFTKGDLRKPVLTVLSRSIRFA